MIILEQFYPSLSLSLSFTHMNPSFPSIFFFYPLYHALNSNVENIASQMEKHFLILYSSSILFLFLTIYYNPHSLFSGLPFPLSSSSLVFSGVTWTQLSPRLSLSLTCFEHWQKQRSGPAFVNCRLSVTSKQLQCICKTLRCINQDESTLKNNFIIPNFTQIINQIPYPQIYIYILVFFIRQNAVGVTWRFCYDWVI